MTQVLDVIYSTNAVLRLHHVLNVWMTSLYAQPSRMGDSVGSLQSLDVTQWKCYLTSIWAVSMRTRVPVRYSRGRKSPLFTKGNLQALWPAGASQILLVLCTREAEERETPHTLEWDPLRYHVMCFLRRVTVIRDTKILSQHWLLVPVLA